MKVQAGSQDKMVAEHRVVNGNQWADELAQQDLTMQHKEIIGQVQHSSPRPWTNGRGKKQNWLEAAVQIKN